MEDLPSNLRISSAEYWFNKGRLNNSADPNLKELREEGIQSNTFSPENSLCLLFGLAYQLAEDYSRNKDAHFKMINSFFFTKAKRLQEAEHLNNLGMSDQILLNTHNYFKNNTRFISEQHNEELEAVLEEIENKSNPAYRNINRLITESRDKINRLKKDFLNMYAGSNVADDKNAQLNIDLFIYNPKREGINSLKRTADKEVNGKQAFPYAAIFLQEVIFEPISKLYDATEDVKITSYLNSLFTSLQTMKTFTTNRK